MPGYSLNVQATSNGTINTEDTYSETEGLIKLKRVMVRLGDGTATAGVDNDFRTRIVRKTATGAGTTSAFTAIRRKQTDRTAGSTTRIKSGTNNFTTATLGDIVMIAVKNGRETFEWISRDEIDYIETHPTVGSGGIAGVLVQSAVASQLFTENAEWEE